MKQPKINSNVRFTDSKVTGTIVAIDTDGGTYLLKIVQGSHVRWMNKPEVE